MIEAVAEINLNIDTAPLSRALEPEIAAGQGLSERAKSLADDLKAGALTGDDVAEARAEWTAHVDHIRERIAPGKKSSHGTWRWICQLEADATAPFEAAIEIVDSALLEWKREEERKAAIAAAEYAAEHADAEADAVLEEAVALETAGEHDAAEALLSRHLTMGVPIAGAGKVTVANAGFRDNWKAEVFDLRALQVYVGSEAGKMFSYLLEPNESALNKLAKALKDDLKIPGVRVKNDEGVTKARAKRKPQ